MNSNASQVSSAAMSSNASQVFSSQPSSPSASSSTDPISELMPMLLRDPHLLHLLHHTAAQDHIDHRGAHPRRDPEWVMIDQCNVNWLYTTITPDDTTYTIWRAIEGNFRDNCLTRAVYIEAELRNMCQGDMSITQYCTKLKSLADSLRDIGQPIRQENQEPLPSFLHARSYLLLEEQSMEQSTKMEAAQAMFTGRKSSSSPATQGSDGGSNSSGRWSRNKEPSIGILLILCNELRHWRRRRQHSAIAPSNRRDAMAWWLQPWMGLFQAWPMPIRMPRTGVLGPRPGVTAQQAYAAQAPQGASNASASAVFPPGAAPPANVWDQTTLIASLNNLAAAPGHQQCCFDTGATSHMSTNPGSSHLGSDSPM
ncbi:uncharacterized protein LOC133927711 [Phragmites australis]|uniref:uncharacterized protein LOC133927711 n=1 Tax=Phragmites australis TaxID=29695 RepID=UPI002D78C275|nr:uncharacterized protein LOC133927711 [Phragmites australis]